MRPVAIGRKGFLFPDSDHGDTGTAACHGLPATVTLDVPQVAGLRFGFGRMGRTKELRGRVQPLKRLN